MNIIVDSKQVNLSSNSSTTNSRSLNSVMLFNLNNILQKQKDILYNQISISHAQIPVSYYLINDTNNMLFITTKKLVKVANTSKSIIYHRQINCHCQYCMAFDYDNCFYAEKKTGQWILQHGHLQEQCNYHV